MNGEERAHAHTSTFTLSDASVSTAAITGAVKGNSWIREMVANPEQAKQAGLVNIHDRSNHRPMQHPRFEAPPRLTASVNVQPPSTRATEFSYQNQLFKNMYEMPSLSSAAAHSPETSQLDIPLADPNRLLVPCVTSSNDSPIVALSALYPNGSKKNVNTFVSTADAQLASKRMKMTTLNDRSSSIPVHPVQHTQPSIPHRPAYFHSGSVIQLGENRLKRIEDLETSDFEYSASISPDLSLDSSTVVRISEDTNRGTAYLTFSVGDQTHKPLEATVEATLEHPFFVFGQGWSSVKPESTLGYYKMKSQQLKIHDRCISLTFKDRSSVDTNGSFGNHSVTESAESLVPIKIAESSQSK